MQVLFCFLPFFSSLFLEVYPHYILPFEAFFLLI
jgi:hypothetical protein